MKFLALIPCCLMLQSMVTYAQWQYEGSPEMGTPVNISSDGDTTLVCTMTSLFYATGSDFKWQEIPVPAEALMIRDIVQQKQEGADEYFRMAKQQPWYDNTLFILVADHGHRLPKKSNLNLPQSKRIPLLFYGNVLKEHVKGKTNTIVGNQNDIAATLLHQLGKPADKFSRSKDLLNPNCNGFAYYTTDYTLGWVTNSQKFIYFYTSKTLNTIGTGAVNDSILLDAKAFLQTHYDEYLRF